MTISLDVSKRDLKKSFDKKETVLGVVYGPKQESTPLTINRKAFEKIFAGAGESTIIALNGLDDEADVLVQDVAFDPVKGGVMHVDFYAIERGKEFTTNVPLVFEGEAPAEKPGEDKEAGVLNKTMQEVEVTCLPRNLPQNIVVDVSVLVDFDSSIRVKDLPLPEGVVIENDAEETVAVVTVVKEEVIEETVDTPDMDAIEVEEKGKGEEAAAETEEKPAE